MKRQTVYGKMSDEDVQNQHPQRLPCKLVEQVVEVEVVEVGVWVEDMGAMNDIDAKMKKKN